MKYEVKLTMIGNINDIIKVKNTADIAISSKNYMNFIFDFDKVAKSKRTNEKYILKKYKTRTIEFMSCSVVEEYRENDLSIISNNSQLFFVEMDLHTNDFYPDDFLKRLSAKLNIIIKVSVQDEETQSDYGFEFNCGKVTYES